MFYGKGKYLVFISVFILIAALTYGQSENNLLYNFNRNQAKTTIVSSENGISINYSLPAVIIHKVTNRELEFFRITADGHNLTSETGKPELPVFSRIIYIPEECVPSVKITELKSEKLRPSRMNLRGILYPRQPDAVKSAQQQRKDLVIDMAVYGRKGLIESDTVRIENVGKVRGRQMATLYISPFRYNPLSNEVEVITSMKVEIRFTRNGGTPLPASKGASTDGETDGKGILNWDDTDFINGYTDRPVEMIILTDTAFSKYIAPLVTWKTRKGFRVTTLYRGSEYAGNSFAELKDSLTAIYNSSDEDNPAPEYLLIIGDVNKIPLSEGTSQVSDLYYGEFDGSGDFIPDMYIGRIPAADTTEVKNVVNKIVQYESFQFADTNRFYDRALVTAGNDGGYATYMNGQVNYAASNYLITQNRIQPSVFNYPQSASADDSIKKLINNGVSFINYSGHGEITGWVDPVLRTGDVTLLKNENMYPFIITNACQTAHFNIANSLGNRMVVSAGKGAIGFIGCSNDSYWDEDFYWAVGVGAITAGPNYNETGLGAYDRLFHTNGEKPSDWYITAGQINYAGNMAVSASTSSRKKYYWETYTVLGDPSLIPYTGTPDTFNIALPDVLPPGIRSITLTAEPFSYVAISRNDTLLDASFASPSGSVVLEIPEIEWDSCMVVVTGQNRVPVIKYIRFSEVPGEYINLSSVQINDASGDDNGKADFGESIYLRLKISNLGLSGASQLYAKISSASNLISVITDSAYIGNLAARTEVIVDNSLRLNVDELIPDRSYATITLKLKDSQTEKNYPIDLALHAPVLEVVSCVIDDTGTGNGDLTADPGETVKLVFSVSNAGTSSTSGIFTITNSPPGIIINQPSVKSGTLASGQVITIPLSITLSPLLLKGTTFEIDALLLSEPYQVGKTFSIPVGKTRESFEYQSFKIFPWQNISPSPWTITSGHSFEGQFSARSGIISHNGESTLKLAVNVPFADTMNFRYKVSSELNYDFLKFRLNGIQNFKVSGEIDWTSRKIDLKEGVNILEWEYRKDESVSSGSDCSWIDFLTFPPTSFNRVDIKTGRIITPKPNDSYDQEKISAEVVNFGTDTLKSFSMAYTINQGNPVTQLFSKTLAPGDTSEVVFSEEANMSGIGTYLIEVYSFGNNDGYLENDTVYLLVVDTIPEVNLLNQLVIMPNPFTDEFRVMFNSIESEQVTISIFDLTGKLRWEESAEVFTGINIITVNPEYLRQGYYTLRIKGRTITKTARLVKS
jgi:hypothetical protein